MLLLKSIGNLAPFLFPTSWMKAKEKVEYAKAERADRDHDACRYDAYVESLVFAYYRDKTVLAVFDDYSSKLQDLLQNVQAPSLWTDGARFSRSNPVFWLIRSREQACGKRRR